MVELLDFAFATINGFFRDDEEMPLQFQPPSM
jgi:hypothetical protein